MTDIDYADSVLMVLSDHALRGHFGCECGWRPAISLNDTESDKKQHRVHQVDVLSAAGLIPTHTEWGVQTRTFLDGPYDRTFTNTSTARLYTEEQAREEVAKTTGPRGHSNSERYTDGKPGARVVSRALTDWRDATDD